MSEARDDHVLTDPPVQFPAVDLATWRRRVEGELGELDFDRSLVSRLPEGLNLQPLYTAADLPDRPEGPGRVSAGAAGAPRVAMEYSVGDLDLCRQALATDSKQGLQLAWLRLQTGLADEASGVATLAGLMQPLSLPPTHVVIEGIGAGLPTGAVLLASAAQLGIDVRSLHGLMGNDPVANWASHGGHLAEVESSYVQLAELGQWAASEAPGLRTVLVDSRTWRSAGATAVDELAIALASSVEAMRRFAEQGWGPDQVAARLFWAFDLGSDLFLEIAKLRAARWLWSKVASASGAGDATVPLHARSAVATSTLLSPVGNLLRNTAQGLAAMAAGADSLALLPYDQQSARPTDEGRRLALHAQYLLAEEGHLDKVADPAAGSYYLEHLTESLARAAWERFRGIEAQGGVIQAMFEGDLRARLEESASERRRRVAQRSEAFVGVSQFADLREAPPEVFGEGARDGSSAEEAEAIPEGLEALPQQRWAAGYESVRLAGEGLAQSLGQRPKVLLAQVGAPKGYLPRSSFATDLLKAGGLESVPQVVADNAAAVRALQESGARLAVICGGDEDYAEAVPWLAPVLVEAGAVRVLVAGRPGARQAADLEAGVADHLYLGCDGEALLWALLTALEPALPTITSGSRRRGQEDGTTAELADREGQP